MCTPSAPNNSTASMISMAMGRGPRLDQYKPPESSKQDQTRFNALSDQYKRWSAEDVGKAGSTKSINQQVSQAQQRFDAQKTEQLRNLGSRSPEERAAQQTSGPINPFSISGRQRARGISPAGQRMISQLQSQQFNADQMRSSLMQAAQLKRIDSGVYGRGYQVTQGSPQQGATVVGGASGRQWSASTSSRKHTGSSTSPAPTGVKLNIGT